MYQRLNHPDESRKQRMTEKRTDLNTCGVCSQSFNSERELQEHQRNAHNRQTPDEKQPGSERSQIDFPDQGDQRGNQREEKIA
jgi:hypothetical protein